MQGLYTLSKPNSTRDTVVFDIMLANPDCNEKFGWDARMENNYSAFLMKVLPKQEFEHFVDEVDKALLKTKLKSGGTFANCLAILACCVPVVCIKAKADKALEDALQDVNGIVKKWNNKFIEDGRPITMKLCVVSRKLNARRELRANGTISAALDNQERMTQIDYEPWIEMQIGSS